MEINKILSYARSIGASDVHLTVLMPPVVRINGELKKLEEYSPLNDSIIKNMCDQIIDNKNKQLLSKNTDIDFSYTSPEDFRYRVNVYHQKGYLACAIRILRDDIPEMIDLGLPPVVAQFVDKPRGLILVTGPTGSGKSTTLAAMINYINQNKKYHIVTIEDPIEYVHKNKKCMINQREIGKDVPDFAYALRSALREDPNVILVGEMRDYETIYAAITAAETGHLVLSTLHTSGAAMTVDRIIGVFPEHQQQQIRTQLSNVLVGIISQTLIPEQNGKDRVGCYEILNVTDAVSAMIRDNKVHMIPSAIQTGKVNGMQSLDQELAMLVNNKTISLKSAEEKCSSKVDLERFLGYNRCVTDDEYFALSIDK